MPADSDAANDILVNRPPFQLRSLPVPVRWEVSRRHPYYLLAWERAGDHHGRFEKRRAPNCLTDQPGSVEQTKVAEKTRHNYMTTI
jgi:hypothetical protein